MSSDPYRIDFPGLAVRDGNPDAGAQKGSRQRHGACRFFLKWGTRLLGLLALTVFPFFALIRGSVYFYHRYALSGWMALAGGVGVTLILLTLYLVFISLKMGRKGRVPKNVLRGTGALVCAYCLYALVYLSGANAKTEEISATYSALNPILRVAVSTLLVVDRDGVLTGTGREPEDYEAWGLSVNEASLHFPQADGFVHAVDIRTLGRPEWQNRAVDAYFRAMGFGTIRHVGTADHLHVELEPSSY